MPSQAAWAAPLSSKQAPANDPHFARGVELQKEGKLQQAIEEYELSLKVTPRFPVLANLGAVYARLGRYQEAISRYEQALQLAPGQPAITLNLGLAHYKSGDLQKAMALFEEVQKVEPENLQTRTLLADCHFQLGEFKKVIEQLEPVAEKYPNDLSIAYLLGTAYLRDKQTEKGQRLVDRSPRHRPDTSDATVTRNSRHAVFVRRRRTDNRSDNRPHRHPWGYVVTRRARNRRALRQTGRHRSARPRVWNRRRRDANGRFARPYEDHAGPRPGTVCRWVRPAGDGLCPWPPAAGGGLVCGSSCGCRDVRPVHVSGNRQGPAAAASRGLAERRR